MKKFIFSLLLSNSALYGGTSNESQLPQFLYKILSMQDWLMTQDNDRVCTPPHDNAFIHFSTEKQYPLIVEKKFNNKDCVIVKIDPTKLQGEIKLEWDTKHTDQYYHLYNGYIPKSAIRGAQFYPQTKNYSID